MVGEQPLQFSRVDGGRVRREDFDGVEAQLLRRSARSGQVVPEDEGAATRLGHLMDARAPLYSEVADIVVPTDGRRVNSVAEHVLRELAAARRR